MEIVYGGKASFTLRGEKTVTVDGSGGDIALHTMRQKNAGLKINGPGEYEVGGVLITSMEKDGTLLHAIVLDDVNIAHIGGRGVSLTERELAACGRVDVLLVESSDARSAGALVADLAPRVVIPFGPNAAAVAASSGVKNAEPQPRFSWNGISAPPRVVLLKEPAARKKAA